MINFKRSLSRRTFLQGTGTVIAMPFLSAMVPSADRHGGHGCSATPSYRVRICPSRDGHDGRGQLVDTAHGGSGTSSSAGR